jgi:hypothetical protein
LEYIGAYPFSFSSSTISISELVNNPKASCLGKKHAFPDGLCSNLGLGNYPVCPIPHEFFLYVNNTLVWFFAVLSAKFSPKKLIYRTRFVQCNYFECDDLYSSLCNNARLQPRFVFCDCNFSTIIFLAVQSLFWRWGIS